MKMLILAALLAALAAPAVACDGAQSVSTSTRDTVASETPQRPGPTAPGS
jgi:hypothetical protein